MYKKYRNLDISEDVCENYKNRKLELMNSLPVAVLMPGMQGFLKTISESNIDCWVVTGSAQDTLVDRLAKEFPGSLVRDKMVTALDVKNGKPDPEPYLRALEKSGFDISEAIVVENAPMGVLSAKAAGLFTIAVNTGPIDHEVLIDAGADLVFQNIVDLIDKWPNILGHLSDQH